MWANRDNDFAQIPADSNDITMFTMRKGQRKILVASVYIPNVGQGLEQDEAELHSRLQEIQTVIRKEQSGEPELELFVADGFNRHDSP
jgi:hypothetical protein